MKARIKLNNRVQVRSGEHAGRCGKVVEMIGVHRDTISINDTVLIDCDGERITVPRILVRLV
jgi:ribosomal protein L24